MLVFIDESGDAGFKMARGSSPIFVTAMVIFDTLEDAATAHKAIQSLQTELRIKPEWKFNKACDDYKDLFFEMAGAHRFRTRAVVVRKDIIYSEALRTVTESFYKFFIRQMMEHDGGALEGADVVIDGSGDRLFKKQFAAYLRKNLREGSMRRMQMKDSQKDPLLQLADMTAGAIARSFREDRKDACRWSDMLKSTGKIDNIWQFK